MSIKVQFPNTGVNNIRVDFDLPEEWEAFQTLIYRGISTWDDAPVEIKEFADFICEGRPLQDYRKLAGVKTLNKLPALLTRKD